VGKRLAILFALFALGLAGWEVVLQRRIDDLQFARRRVAFLESENERLRAFLAGEEKKKARAAEAEERAAVEKAVVAIRGLEFLKPVVYDVVTKQGIRETLRRKLSDLFTETEFRDAATGYAAMGLMERGYPLREKYLDLLGEQVAAFYDQHQHRLFMFKDASLENSQNRVVLAHELTHALQDQHFGLTNLPLELKNNDDQTLAASALVEGDATMVMSEYMLKNFSWRGLRDNFSGMMSQNLNQLESAPRYLREMLVFPYLRGQEFCEALAARGGYAAVSSAFAHPPSSTSQILHPEKYLAEPREEPQRISWPETNVLGQAPLCDNVMGEMGVRVLLTDWVDPDTARNASAGWRGDRYLVYDEGGAVVWKTVWDAPENAAQFIAALKRCLQKRYKLSSSKIVESDGSFAVKEPRDILLLSPTPTEVLLLDASTARWADALAHAFAPR